MTETNPGPAALSADPGGYPADLSNERLHAVVQRLASDEYAGRRLGTPGGHAAARWLAEHLGALGATAAIDAIPAAPVTEVYATPRLTWTVAGRTEVLVHRRDFAEHLASADQTTPATGPLATTDAPEMSGRWVLAPGYVADAAARFGRAGAVGMLVPRDVDDAGWMPKMIAGPAACDIAVLSIRTDLHCHLTQSLSDGRAVTVAGSAPLRTTSAVGANVYGVFAEPGDGMASVLLAAHFDGVGDDPDVRLPAACDNASGVAVVIEAARLLAPLLPAGVGLAVALLDGEEVGARGSAHHADQVAEGTFVLNVDGAAQLHQAAAVEAGGPAHRLLAALDQAGRAAGVPLAAGAMPSDNRRYAAAGLPAVGIGMGVPGYQTPAETADRVEVTTLIEATWLVVATVRILIHNNPHR